MSTGVSGTGGGVSRPLADAGDDSSPAPAAGGTTGVGRDRRWGRGLAARLGGGRGRVAVPSLMAGGLLTLSLPPLGLWMVAPLGAGLLWWRLGGLRARSRLWAGWLAGLGLFVPGLYWSLSFNLAGGLLLMALESLALGAAALISPGGRGRLLALPGAMVLTEALRSSWPFGGLPLGSVALGQVSGPLLGADRLGGPLALVGLTWLAGAGLGAAGAAVTARLAWIRHQRRQDRQWAQLAAAARPAPLGPAEPAAAAPTVGTGAGRFAAAGGRPTQRPPRLARPILAGLVAVAAVAGFAAAGAAAPDGGPARSILRVAAVQGGGRRGLRKGQVDPSLVYQAALAATAEVPTAAHGQLPKLVLWPEDVVSLDSPLHDNPTVEHQLASIAERLHATLVVGVTATVSSTAFRNEAVAFGPSGAIVGTYEKVHRVPFGEYVPDRAFFAHFANLSAVPLDAVPGHGTGMVRTDVGRLGIMISFEVFFPARAVSAVHAGASVLLVPTNTSSYSTTQVPGQEVAADRFEAVTTGRDLVQAAPTGYSTVVSSHGAVEMRSALGSADVLVATVARHDGATLYDRAGSLPVLLAAAILLVLGWATHVRGHGGAGAS